MKIFRGLPEKFLNPNSIKSDNKHLDLCQCATCKDKEKLHNAVLLIGRILLATVLLVGAMCGRAQAGEINIEGHSLSAWSTAIRHAEGNANYGILSVQCTPGDDCRRICANTVRNNYKRWIKAGRPGTYLDFLGNRYCPVGAINDPHGLNKNWVKNVKYWLAKNK